MHIACRLAEAADASREVGDSRKASHAEGGGGCFHMDVFCWVFVVARM